MRLSSKKFMHKAKMQVIKHNLKNFKSIKK